MVQILKEGLLSVKWIPRLETLRYRRVNVQRPRAPHYERAKYLALVKPFYKIDESTYLPPSVTCRKNIELQEKTLRIDNPLERIIAKELYEKFEESKLIGFLHTNPLSGEEEFHARVLLKRENMEIEKYSKKTVERAVTGTKYEAILPLFITHNAIVFSKEPNVDKLMRVLKKVPQYILMAGIVDQKLVSLTQLKTYSEIKDITNARAQLMGVLNCFGQSIINNLTAHPRNLAVQLQLYSEKESEKS